MRSAWQVDTKFLAHTLYQSLTLVLASANRDQYQLIARAHDEIARHRECHKIGEDRTCNQSGFWLLHRLNSAVAPLRGHRTPVKLPAPPLRRPAKGRKHE